MALGVSLAAVLAAGMTALPAPARAVAVGTTLYVDGKHGADDNTGLSWGEALRTINRAARKVPRGQAAAGWTVVVRGYADFIYRERPVPGAYDRWGTESSPLVFTAEGWAPGDTSYTKPIVSGGMAAPLPGNGWRADSTSGVWSTPWSVVPTGFNRSKPYTGAIFQDQSRWLWQHASLSDLRHKAGRGDGGYWFDGVAHRLYVATRGGVNPGSASIEVPVRRGFYFAGSAGAHDISVRGFSVRHTSMGIAFHVGADHNSALDNDILGSMPMAFATSGRVTSHGVDEAVGNVFLRNSASYSTLQGFKVDAGSRNTVICDNTVHHNAFQGIKVQGAADAGDPRRTNGTEICRNLIANQDSRRLGASRGDETPNGVTLSNGAGGSYVHHNTIRGNTVGVLLNQRGSGGKPISGTQLSRNVISGNRSSGLSLRDGVADRTDGTGSLVARYNVYAGNGTGINLASGSSHKSFAHETVYDSTGSGVQVGCGCAAPAAMTMTDSLVTHNGRYGVLVASRQHAQLSYVGLASNRSGPTSGPVAKSHLNTKRAGYLSLDATSADFLRIGSTSFQYTAGTGGQPVGARY
jgi:hypothetical protein